MEVGIPTFNWIQKKNMTPKQRTDTSIAKVLWNREQHTSNFSNLNINLKHDICIPLEEVYPASIEFKKNMTPKTKNRHQHSHRLLKERATHKRCQQPQHQPWTWHMHTFRWSTHLQSKTNRKKMKPKQRNATSIAKVFWNREQHTSNISYFKQTADRIAQITLPFNSSGVWKSNFSTKMTYRIAILTCVYKVPANIK